MFFFFFFKQKTAYEMRISDWSSDVCSSDLHAVTDRQWLARTLRFPDRLDLVDEIHVTLAVRLERIDQTAEREDVMRLLDRNAAVAAVCRDQRIGRVLFLGQRDHVDRKSVG